MVSLVTEHQVLRCHFAELVWDIPRSWGEMKITSSRSSWVPQSTILGLRSGHWVATGTIQGTFYFTWWQWKPNIPYHPGKRERAFDKGLHEADDQGLTLRNTPLSRAGWLSYGPAEGREQDKVPLHQNISNHSKSYVYPLPIIYFLTLCIFQRHNNDYLPIFFINIFCYIKIWSSLTAEDIESSCNNSQRQEYRITYLSAYSFKKP